MSHPLTRLELQAELITCLENHIANNRWFLLVGRAISSFSLDPLINHQTSRAQKALNALRGQENIAPYEVLGILKRLMGAKGRGWSSTQRYRMRLSDTETSYNAPPLLYPRAANRAFTDLLTDLWSRLLRLDMGADTLAYVHNSGYYSQNCTYYYGTQRAARWESFSHETCATLSEDSPLLHLAIGFGHNEAILPLMQKHLEKGDHDDFYVLGTALRHHALGNQVSYFRGNKYIYFSGDRDYQNPAALAIMLQALDAENVSPFKKLQVLNVAQQSIARAINYAGINSLIDIWRTRRHDGCQRISDAWNAALDDLLNGDNLPEGETDTMEKIAGLLSIDRRLAQKIDPDRIINVIMTRIDEIRIRCMAPDNATETDHNIRVFSAFFQLIEELPPGQILGIVERLTSVRIDPQDDDDGELPPPACQEPASEQLIERLLSDAASDDWQQKSVALLFLRNKVFYMQHMDTLKKSPERIHGWARHNLHQYVDVSVLMSINPSVQLSTNEVLRQRHQPPCCKMTPEVLDALLNASPPSPRMRAHQDTSGISTSPHVLLPRPSARQSHAKEPSHGLSMTPSS